MTTAFMRVLIGVAVLISTTTARADATAPWEEGVPADRQQRATAVFAEANSLFAQEAYPGALERYRAAIALWDHPQIRFNMAVALMRLSRDVEALDAIDAALEWGAQPFTPALYRKGLAYQRELQDRIGTIEASCTQKGVSVTLDGQPWFSCPGTGKRRVTPGSHSIVAEGRELMTLSQRIAVKAGSVAPARIALVPVSRNVIVAGPRHRWAPWLVAGLGVAAAATGAAAWFKGYRGMADTDARLTDLCAAGCSKTSEPYIDAMDSRARAERTSQIGTGLVIGGGAVVMVGVVWALLQRPAHHQPAVDVTPTGDGLRASVGWHF